MLSGLRAGNKAVYDLWAIEPFVQNPQWRQINTNGIFDNKSLVNAKMLWDSDRDTYMILGGANAIDPITGQGVYASQSSLLSRFKIVEDEVIPTSTCTDEQCN